MDDFIISNLNDSRNEWCERLIYILITPIMEGIKSIFNESLKMCLENNEPQKYLMTFQNILSKIPNWNSNIIQEEVNRIVQKSGCNYISELISCVHIIQLKVLTCVRVGNKQKKIDITIPKLDNFIHSVYIHAARMLYKNVYLFQKIPDQLKTQKNNHEIENIIRECILITIRESIPTEQIVRAYLDESVEHEEEITIENIEEPVLQKLDDEMNNCTSSSVTKELPKREEIDKMENTTSNDDNNEIFVSTIKSLNENTEPVTTLKFNNIDYVLDENDDKQELNAPKDIETLEEISMSNAIKRKLQEENEEEEDDDNEKLTIHSDNVNLTDLGVFSIDSPDLQLKPGGNIPLLDIEEIH
jgi:hypothetical protein